MKDETKPKDVANSLAPSSLRLCLKTFFVPFAFFVVTAFVDHIWRAQQESNLYHQVYEVTPTITSN